MDLPKEWESDNNRYVIKVNGTKRVEFQVFLAILGVAILNVFVYASLSPNQGDPTSNIMRAILYAVMIYGFSTIMCIVFMILKKPRLLTCVFYALLTFMVFHLIVNLYTLIFDPIISDNGQAILSDAFLIWSSSLLTFCLWYWIIDRGGPVARAEEKQETRYDLLFPQYQSNIPGWEHWKPKLLDYAFFSFFTSTGFSPADTLPLTKRTKLLMMIEASLSLVIIGMVAARAISLIQ